MRKTNTFWNWFQDNNKTIQNIANETPKNQKHISFWIDKHLKFYCKELDFILVFSKIKTTKSEMIITANGNPDYFHQVIHLVDNAPQLKNWKFTAFIQPTSEIYKISIGLDDPYIFQDITLKASELKFTPLDYEEEKWGAWTSGVNLVSQVACIIILSFGYSLKYIESGKSRYFLFACIIFILCYFYDIYLSVRYVKAIQAAHPEKKGDPTSSKFTEQWVESCDEAEKEIIYKSAYKTYIVLNKVIPILLLLTLIANMFLNTGILAVLVVAVIYLVTGMTYIRSSMVSKAKRIG